MFFELELEGMLDVEKRELFFCGLQRWFKRLHTSGDFGLFPLCLTLAVGSMMSVDRALDVDGRGSFGRRRLETSSLPSAP